MFNPCWPAEQACFVLRIFGEQRRKGAEREARARGRAHSSPALAWLSSLFCLFWHQYKTRLSCLTEWATIHLSILWPWWVHSQTLLLSESFGINNNWTKPGSCQVYHFNKGNQDGFTTPLATRAFLIKKKHAKRGCCELLLSLHGVLLCVRRGCLSHASSTPDWQNFARLKSCLCHIFI